jgi:hypothetical protein
VASRFVLNRPAADAFARKQATLYVAKVAARIEGAAKEQAPVRKPNENGRSGGRLRASIGTKLTVSTYHVKARVGSRVNHAEPAHQGARRHIIRPRRKQFLSFKWNKAAGYGIPLTRRGKVQLKRVNHPGMKGVPYLVGPMLTFAPAAGFRVTFVRPIR